VILDDLQHESLHEEIESLLGWDTVGNEEVRRQLETIYRSVADERVPGAIIPVIRADRVWFCAAADNASEWRKLAPLVMAAAGMTLTSFDGRPAEPPASGQSEPFTSRGLTITWFAGVKEPDRRWDSVSALFRMVRMLQAAPPGLRALPRSPAQLLNQFDLTIQAGDRQGAEAALLELERGRAVDALNLHFLRVRWHQSFLQWDELRAERWFANAAHARRPHEVTNQLIRALLEVDLGGLARPADPGALLERFRATVTPEAGNLFEVLTPERSPAASTMYLLDALERGDRERIDRLRALDRGGWSVHERARFDELLEISPADGGAGEPAPPLDLEAELDRYLKSDDSISEQQQTVLTALQMSDEPLTVAVLLGALAMTPSIPAVTPSVPVLNEPRAQKEAEEAPPPADWFEWFALPPDVSFRASRDHAERIAGTKSVDDQLPNQDRRDRFINSFQELVTADPQRASTALPHIASWLQGDPEWPSIDLATVYEEMVMAFLISDTRSVEALNSMLTVLDGWLAVGPERAQYADLVGALQGELEAFVSEHALDVLIDLAELLVIHPCADVNARVGLWSDLVRRLGGLQSRMSASQVVVLNSLGDAIGAPVEFAHPSDSEATPEVSYGDWSGVIGLYTLRDDVASRVKLTLAKVLPSADVQHNNDFVATAGLRGLVGRADMMAVDASAAKHSATQAIKAELAGREPLWVRGGASSMVSAVLGRIREGLTG
jgi:hypothetical protein